jgi:hypothetical protein
VRIRRRYWVVFATLLVTATLAIAGAVAAHLPFSSETLRRKVAAVLSDRLDAEVELGALSFRVFPRVSVSGGTLVVHHRGRRDIPPLIAMDGFTVDADFVGLWRKRIRRLNVEGLAIQIAAKKDRSNRSTPRTASERDYVIEELIANEATLTIIPENPEKRPRVWQMHELELQQVGIAQEMPFKSVLTNAVPPGRLTTSGTFGPWDVEEPGQTPLNGEFVFEDADLSVFKGISGMLSAHGTYRGELERIDINGETKTPDFTLSISGHPVQLDTTYHAIVDGTNGDTTLERIDARFLNSSLVARGGVYHKEGVPGRTVTLEVSMDKARIEDMMRLAVKTARAPMTGGLTLRTTFELPPGDKDVVEKLMLDGRFTIVDGRFADPLVQEKIGELSRRASGKVNERRPMPRVDSDFAGRFRLGNGVMVLPSVTFVVPGAAVQLAGRYGLQTEALAFAGNLYMDARISQTTTGWKSLLLKLVDPLFRKDGQTIVPIKIEGRREAPEFGLDTGRVFRRGDTKPRPGPGPAPKT